MTKTFDNGWLWGHWSALGLGTALSVAVVDQVHKWWMLNVYDIAGRGRVEVAPFMDLVFVINKGISYGLFNQESQAGQLVLAAFAFAVSIALATWLARSADGRVMAMSIGFVIGGAIGNAVDRLHLGGVADFFSLHAFGYYWYVFNIADVAIVVGVLGLLYDSFVAARFRDRRIADEQNG